MKTLLRMFVVCVLLLTSCSINQSEETQSNEVVMPVIGVNSPSSNEQSDQGYPIGDYPSVNTSVIDNAYPAALNALSTLPAGQLPSAPSDAPQPQAGMASISGTIFSFTSFVEIADTTVYLTPALGENNEFPPLLTGPNSATGDIQGRTNAQGQLLLDNVPQGDYYLAVWAPYNWTPVVDPSVDPPSPILFTFEPDQSYPLGVLQVTWP